LVGKPGLFLFSLLPCFSKKIKDKRREKIEFC
jgi:hypothetical protein